MIVTILSEIYHVINEIGSPSGFKAGGRPVIVTLSERSRLIAREYDSFVN